MERRGSHSPPINTTALQKSFHYAVGNYCKSIEKDNLNACVRAQNGGSSPVDDDDDTLLTTHQVPQMTVGAIAALTDLAYTFITENLATDLEAFSQHANRRTITGDDVILTARKNPNGLRNRLQQVLENKRTDTMTEKQSKTIHDWDDRKRNFQHMASSSSSDDEMELEQKREVASLSRSSSSSSMSRKIRALDDSQIDGAKAPLLQSSSDSSQENKPLHFSKISSNKKTNKHRRIACDDDETEEEDDDENELVVFDTSPKSTSYHKAPQVFKDEVINLADDDDDDD